MMEKLHSGELYDPNAREIAELQLRCLEKLYDYNQTRPADQDRRAALLREMFAEIGEGCYLEPPLRANWAGRFARFGKKIYANFGLTLVDDTEIRVGDCSMFGPNVVIATAGHPILPELRKLALQYNAPVRIGRNCWIGAGAIILPGVSIGDNTVVGAGSVVTRDLPANVVAAGNPCRVLRPIGERDRQVYFRDRPIPPELLPPVVPSPGAEE
ncbi:MAG: sugar O-acetyltransferase [Oscillospiraceae bacterium]|nr:sugar O-acetyltransferase [Oscillospiraceae bacterium]